MSLKDVFSDLFSIASSKDVRVADDWDGDSWNPRFVRQLNDWELEEVDIFFERLYDHSISMDIEDSVEWVDTKSGIFFVRSFDSLAGTGVDHFPHSVVWNSWVPVRVSFFAWEATWVKILTLDQLKKRGWKMPNRCYMCKEERGNECSYSSSLPESSYIVAAYFCFIRCSMGDALLGEKFTLKLGRLSYW